MNIDIKVVEVFDKIKLYCEAIYQGGSRLDPVIENPHDYDYICFAKDLQRHNLLRILISHGFKTTGSKRKLKQMSTNSIQEDLYDFSQIRSYPYTKIDWFSYLDILMIKVVGEDICPKTDIISKYRNEFITDLKVKANKLTKNIITNQKRWYHILRGIYILLNNSYAVTDEQKKEINILHDLSEGWEEIRDKTKYLLDTIK